MKIHFASVIGVDYDLDLAPYWMEYYLARKLDSYTAMLHRENGEIPACVIADYRNAGFKVVCLDGPFGEGRLRGAHLSNMAQNLDNNDILVTADADEFQAMPDGSPIDYRYCCERFDLLHGLFEDRYSDTIEACVMDPFLQYPYAEEPTGEYLKSFTPPWLHKTKWCELRRSKILAARAGYDVAYTGSHCLHSTPADASVLYGCKVVHFAWRRGNVQKMAVKKYFTKENILEVTNGKEPAYA